MKRKKIYLIAATLTLCIAIGVAGTFAFLTNSADPVKNTFIAAGGNKLISDPNSFTLDEHEAVPGENGAYTINPEKITNKNDYSIYPGVNVPKDPTVHLSDLTNAKSLLFIEVVDKTPDALTCTISSDWTEVEGVTGMHDGKIYSYNNGQILSEGFNKDIPVLENNRVLVANVDDLGLNTSVDFTVYSYLCQASAGAEIGSETTTPAQVVVECGFAE